MPPSGCGVALRKYLVRALMGHQNARALLSAEAGSASVSVDTVDHSVIGPSAQGIVALERDEASATR